MGFDSLGDRMKQQYEDRTRFALPRRTYTILRADGKSFHTFTRHCTKPHDQALADAVDAGAQALCREAQGVALAYVQSDEISVLLTDFATITTEAWFDGNVQKIVSVAAALVTAAFNAAYHSDMSAVFDCRAFTIPDPTEVENYLLWRQQDATRNSIQSLAQAHFSAKSLHGLNTSQLQDRLMLEKGINWNAEPADRKRGRIILRSEFGWRIDTDIPVFTQDRDYLRAMIPRIPA